MAEFVQQNLEEMIPELEQLQRVQLFSEEEVRQVLKKRKRFEYKLQKQTKKKEDFLNYIQYETSLMALISIRREKLGYAHKKDEIDYAIARRINKLFKILEHRFQHDLKIWTSHIEFLKKMNWKSDVGKIYRRMLQVHANNVQAWISAAKFELEEAGNPENARNTMLEGIRFHPKSEELFREYFRLELIYVDLLRKRSSILGINQLEVAEETRDKVMEGQIVLTVFRRAVEVIPDPNFAASLLSVVCTCKAPFPSVRSEIISYLREKCATEAEAWDALARESLYDKEKSFSRKIESCCQIYENGLEKSSDTKLMLELFIDTLINLPKVVKNLGKKSLANLADILLNKFHWGHERELLNEKHYKLWIDLIDEERDEVLEKARKRFPESISLFREELARDFAEENGLKVEGIIHKFFENYPKLKKDDGGEKRELWEFMFVNVSANSKEEEDSANILSDFFEKAELMLRERSRESSSSYLRLLYIDHMYTIKGIEATRKFYDDQSYVPPFFLDFHLKALELEKMEKKIDVKRIRKIYENAADQFGKDNLGIWLDYMKFEREQGNGTFYSLIVNRAERMLREDLKEELISQKDFI